MMNVKHVPSVRLLYRRMTMLFNGVHKSLMKVTYSNDDGGDK
jgi:hypothetical protein